MDAPSAADDLRALREHLPGDALIGAGTVLTAAQLEAARIVPARRSPSPRCSTRRWSRRRWPAASPSSPAP